MKLLENIIARDDRFVEEVRRAKAKQIVSINANESEIQWKRPPSGWVKVTDRMAARGCNSERTAVLLSLPPMEIRGLVEEELRNSNMVTVEFVR
ncbi:hypothetical protein V6N13_111671 [Hibiscus sabdariffa]